MTELNTAVYFSPELLTLLRKNTQMSPATWHKVMNPLCPRCLRERYGR